MKIIRRKSAQRYAGCVQYMQAVYKVCRLLSNWHSALLRGNARQGRTVMNMVTILLFDELPGPE